MPAGSYRIELDSGIQSADFNPAEDALLSDDAAFGGHPVVQLTAGSPVRGASLEVLDLVRAGYVFVDDSMQLLESLTDEMRAGETIFEIILP